MYIFFFLSFFFSFSISFTYVHWASRFSSGTALSLLRLLFQPRREGTAVPLRIFSTRIPKVVRHAGSLNALPNNPTPPAE